MIKESRKNVSALKPAQGRSEKTGDPYCHFLGERIQEDKERSFRKGSFAGGETLRGGGRQTILKYFPEKIFFSETGCGGRDRKKENPCWGLESAIRQRSAKVALLENYKKSSVKEKPQSGGGRRNLYRKERREGLFLAFLQQSCSG